MKHVARYGILLPAALLVVSGCATKNWVRTELSKQETEISQRIVRWTNGSATSLST